MKFNYIKYISLLIALVIFLSFNFSFHNMRAESQFSPNLVIIFSDFPLIYWWYKNNPNIVFYLIIEEIEEAWLFNFDPIFLIKNFSLEDNFYDQLFINIYGINFTLFKEIKNLSFTLINLLNQLKFSLEYKNDSLNLIKNIENKNLKLISSNLLITFFSLDVNNITKEYNYKLSNIYEFINNVNNLNISSYQKLNNYINDLNDFLNKKFLSLYNYSENNYNKILEINKYKDAFHPFRFVFSKFKWISKENELKINDELIGKVIEFKLENISDQSLIFLKDKLKFSLRIYFKSLYEKIAKINYFVSVSSFILEIILKWQFNYDKIKDLEISNVINPYLIFSYKQGLVLLQNDTINAIKNENFLKENFKNFLYIIKGIKFSKENLNVQILELEDKTFELAYKHNETFFSLFNFPLFSFYFNDKVYDFEPRRLILFKEGINKMYTILPYYSDMYLDIALKVSLSTISNYSEYIVKIPLSYERDYKVEKLTNKLEVAESWFNLSYLFLIMLVIILFLIYFIFIKKKGLTKKIKLSIKIRK